MSEHAADNQWHRPTISVSVPPAQQEAFFQALARLKQRDDNAFISVSALIVRAVIHAAHELDTISAPPRQPGEAPHV